MSATLIIDSVTENEPNFHIEVENMGSSLVTLIRYIYKTKTITNMQEPPENAQSMILPKGGKITIPGIIGAEIAKIPNLLKLTMIYEIRIGSKRDTFTSLYDFFVDHSLRPSERFAATKHRVMSGDIGDGDARKSVIDGLSKPKGFVALFVPELLPDGTPNKVAFAASGKRLLFDPVDGMVTFSDRLQSGEVKVVAGDIKTGTGDDVHYVRASWDDQNKTISLKVDEKTFP